MRILIAEDTNTIASVLQVYLMGLKVEFEVARDGREALSLARQRAPDLIISDVQMPVMDGLALCAAVRADRQLFAVPLVLLTSLKDDATRQRGRLVGATAFLTKPVSAEELRKTVTSLLPQK